MAEIVNLRSARKAKARAAADQQAEHNRRVYGRSKAEKQQSAREQQRISSKVDGARRDPE